MPIGISEKIIQKKHCYSQSNYPVLKIISIYSNIAPHYRKGIWAKLISDKLNEFHFYFGKSTKSNILKIDFDQQAFNNYQNRLHLLKNIYIGHILVWQLGVIKSCLFKKTDIAVFIAEANCISTWIASIICRLRGIKVVFWGHGLYGNENRLKLWFRKLFYTLADKHLVYERGAKFRMIAQGFKSSKIYVVFNSLEYNEQKKILKLINDSKKSEVFSNFNNPELPVVSFVGRLTEIKKIDILIRAVNQINLNKTRVNLLIIGDGEERENLIKIAEQGLSHQWIYFTGACYDERKISQLLYFSEVCVSPGNVGLTAIHSLTFGTPVCTHDNFKNQMPEFEAIKDQHNGFFFKENDVDDLVSKISLWISDNKNREMVRQKCYEIIDQYYNPDYQFEVFNRMITNKYPEI